MKMVLSDLIISTTGSYLGLFTTTCPPDMLPHSPPWGHHNISTAIQSFKHLSQLCVLIRSPVLSKELEIPNPYIPVVLMTIRNMTHDPIRT